MLCVVKYSSRRQADRSSRVFLLSVACLNVIVKPCVVEKRRRILEAVKWEDVDLAFLGLSTNRGGCMGIFQVL